MGFFGTRRLDHGFVIWDDPDECPGVDGIRREIFEFLDADFAGDSPCIVLTSVGVETFDVVLPDGLHFFAKCSRLFLGKRARFVVMNKPRTTTKTVKSSESGVRSKGRVNRPAAVVTETRQEEVARKLGGRMRDLRLEKRMSLAQMQQRGGLTPSQMSSVERGRVQVSLGTVVSVSVALEMPTFMVLLLPDEDPLSAVLEEIRQAYGGDWRRAAFVIAGALGLDLSKLMAR